MTRRYRTRTNHFSSSSPQCKGFSERSPRHGQLHSGYCLRQQLFTTLLPNMNFGAYLNRASPSFCLHFSLCPSLTSYRNQKPLFSDFAEPLQPIAARKNSFGVIGILRRVVFCEYEEALPQPLSWLPEPGAEGGACTTAGGVSSKCWA